MGPLGMAERGDRISTIYDLYYVCSTEYNLSVSDSPITLSKLDNFDTN